jgi:hypothetical protein
VSSHIVLVEETPLLDALFTILTVISVGAIALFLTLPENCAAILF